MLVMLKLQSEDYFFVVKNKISNFQYLTIAQFLQYV